MTGDPPVRDDLELVVDDLSFPTSMTFDGAGGVYVAESGLPFGGASPGGRVWALDEDGVRRLLAEDLLPPVNGLAWARRRPARLRGRAPTADQPHRSRRQPLHGAGTADVLAQMMATVRTQVAEEEGPDGMIERLRRTVGDHRMAEIGRSVA